ncbi:fibronectin type III domain protein [Cooperia oncophora]
MRQLFLLTTLLQTVITFTVVPYIQIDYAHYFHLAQCQAKCAQKYGTPATRHLLDGSIEEYLDVHNADSEACESGCHQHRRIHGKGQKGPSKTAINDGLKFWAESSADSAKAGSTLISSVQLLCQNPSIDEEFGESSEGFVSVSLLRPGGPTRYVVQWKQRTHAMGYYDESQWITASVESSTLFQVKGLIPGVQYRFMVTAVGPAGRLGETITSPWTEILADSEIRPPLAPLVIKNGYNSDRGVNVHLEWPRTPQDSCYYKLQLSNTSTQLTRDITLDSSSSILLPHLEFATDYAVTVAAVSVDKLQMSKPVTANFRSLQCRDVHGRGSLLCPPEPVSDLTVVLRPNGTGLVSWTPSADPQNILFYQIVYHAVSNAYDCQTQPETINVRATTTSAEVEFPGHQCEYMVRLINYDLIGRDASADVRVLIEPVLPAHFDIVFRPECLLVGACIVLLPFICILLRCRCRRKCPQRVSEKQQKLTQYA